MASGRSAMSVYDFAFTAEIEALLPPASMR
jgi:hypothetical protein